MAISSLPLALYRHARCQEGLVTHHQCDEHGISHDVRTRLVRSGQWRRVTRGVYDPGIIEDPTEWEHRRMRQVWVGILAGGPRAVAVGPCALAVHGVWGLPIDVKPQIALPRGAFAHPGEEVRVRSFGQWDEVQMVDGIPVVPPEHALAQSICEMFRETAVSVLDSALNLDVVDRSDLRTVRRLLRGRRGAARTHEWWPLVDQRAESPIETRARLIFRDAGMAPDQLQVPIVAMDGTELGYGDMGWRLPGGAWLIVEMDGKEVHERPTAVFHDRHRQNDFLTAGATILRFTGSDLRYPARMVSLVRQGIAGSARAA
ncbi:type IV toxin-antitoxin system AbiEi family antitoxin domain-containing protein [Ruania alba]|uniref:Transcriptional regulator, AbiEi antitoxin, Type IV TA system n=1 Tax=Ruania alba TaxID=648782 RepID=A0A1H5MMV9_9MICO|nr:type IV toxin-antitoxin system AbiEi family antitoxin domain-containing protein [Ruania alba]SEE90646.1 hypothetical protein SAMN04488554_3506 [Ruania alba]